MDRITKAKIEKYISITKKALGSVVIGVPKKSHLYLIAEDSLDMARRYFEDAKYYREKGDLVTAFASVNYAHGWLDSGARMGLFKVNKNKQLFTVD